MSQIQGFRPSAKGAAMTAGYVIARNEREAVCMDLRNKGDAEYLLRGCGPEWKLYRVTIKAEPVRKPRKVRL